MSQTFAARKSLASLLSIAVLALGPSGCTSVGVTAAVAPSEPAACGLDVRVFDRAADAKAHHPTAGYVTSDLETRSGSAVHHTDGAEWSLSGLAPGEYRLTVRQWKKGRSRSESPDVETTKSLTLKPGERTAVDVVARTVTTGAAVGVTAAVLVVAAAVVAAVSVQNSLNNMHFQLERAATEPLPLGLAASPVPGGATPSPEELENLARTVAQAFPE